MIDPNTMTLDQLRDWLAEHAGWRIERDGILVHPDEEDGRAQRSGVLPRHDHPFPATLDAAAAALPEGWRTYYIGFAIETVEANAMHIESGGMVRNTSATEILARFRLAALCIIAEEKDHAK